MRTYALCTLLLLPLAACASGPPPYATTLGLLRPHETITIHIQRGTVNAYAPLVGDRKDRFTLQAFAQPNSSPPAPLVHRVKGGVDVEAPALRSLLVRVPQGDNLAVLSGNGNVNVTDISGNATFAMHDGDADVMLPGYAQGTISGSGTLKVIMGASTWPGTLRFIDNRGDVDVSINENARFHVHLHTGNGTIFTDFNLRGSSSGTSETIDGPVNGGAANGIDVETRAGSIRLLQLAPQI